MLPPWLLAQPLASSPLVKKLYLLLSSNPGEIACFDDHLPTESDSKNEYEDFVDDEYSETPKNYLPLNLAVDICLEFWDYKITLYC